MDDLLHQSAYSEVASIYEDEDDFPVGQLQGRYRDRYHEQIAQNKAYAYYGDDNKELNEEKSDSSDTDDSDSDSTPRQADASLSKRTEIVEADRIVLPSILTSDDKLDWTLRFVNLSKDLRRKQPYPYLARTITKLGILERDFFQTARLYSKIIIDEKFLPDEKKTIKPANMGGIAGGLKYFQEGILFKFALDSHNLYGGDVNAMKSAAHEMKCLVALFKKLKPDYFVPMVGVIDYKGFRIIAISLLPIKGSTLVYGSNDGGRTFNSSEPVVNNDMNELGASLNLQAHKAPGGPSIRTPADLEVHKGTDGLFYLVDVARLWPPEPPSVRGSFLYRLLREEFVTTYKKPLSSDAFSGFAAADPSSKEHNSDVKEAFVFYIKNLVPAAAQELHAMPAGTDLETYLHSRGINFRHMGLLWQHLPQFSPWRRVVMSEIVTRAAKSALRSLMRRTIQRFGVHNKEPFLKLIASFFNLLLGTSEDSTAYWHNELFRTVRDSFFYISKTDEELHADEISLRDEVDEQRVFTSLLRDFGVQLKESFWKNFAAQPLVVEDTDIEEVVPVTKRSDIGRLALALYLIDNTECKVKSDDTMKVHKKALGMLQDKSLANNNNVFVIFRYMCRAIIALPIESSIPTIPRLRDLTNQIWTILETMEEEYKLNAALFLEDLSCLFMFLGTNQPKARHTPATISCLVDIFKPYFITLSFSPNKDLLKKRAVLSEDLFKEIEELDFQSTKYLHPVMIVRTLEKLPNLKTITIGDDITSDILQCLNRTNTKLENVFIPDSNDITTAHIQAFFKAHPNLKRVTLKHFGEKAVGAMSSLTHKNLEYFDCDKAMFSSLSQKGDINAEALVWLKEHNNLKRLHIRDLPLVGASSSKLAAVIPQIEELTFELSAAIPIEPIEPILALKHLTRLVLSGYDLNQKNIVLASPLNIRQLVMKKYKGSPDVIATIIKNSPHLEQLNMKSSVLNNECCLALSNCPKLEVLHLKRTTLTAEGLKAIAKCRKLKHLSIGWVTSEKYVAEPSPCTEVNFAHFTPILPNLEMLDLEEYQKLTDTCVNVILTTCKKLQKLKLRPVISDKAFNVNSHSSAQTLTHLDIFGSAVTDAGMAIIFNNYPNMKIFKAPVNITIRTFKRLPRWSQLQRIMVAAAGQNLFATPNLERNLNALNLVLSTSAETKPMLVEYDPRNSASKMLSLVGCLGGTRLTLTADVHVVIKLFQKK